MSSKIIISEFQYFHKITQKNWLTVFSKKQQQKTTTPPHKQTKTYHG